MSGVSIPVLPEQPSMFALGQTRSLRIARPGGGEPGFCLWISVMVLPNDCHANVNECLNRAATASTDTERAAWLALAESWLRLARKTEVQETASSMSVAREVRRQTHRKNLMLWLTTTGQGHGFLTALINFGEIAV